VRERAFVGVYTASVREARLEGRRRSAVYPPVRC
jgi:hypothetical protein